MIDIFLQTVPYICWGAACGAWYMVARLRQKHIKTLQGHIEILQHHVALLSMENTMLKKVKEGYERDNQGTDLLRIQ